MTRQAIDFTTLHTPDEWEAAARAVLTPMAYDYYRGGAVDELALRRNRDALDEQVLHYRVLRDVSRVDTSISLLGLDLAAPIVVAPTAYHKLAHPEGELASSRGTADAGLLFTLSTLASTSLEDVAQGCKSPKWFQLYVHRDHGLTRSLVTRAEGAGYRALVLTVDAPVLGRRPRDERNGFTLPPGVGMPNLEAYAHASGQGSELAAYVRDRHDASLTFDGLTKLCASTKLPVLVKGIVRADDATRALAAGASGIVVSNHGGRQLDAAPAPIHVLPRIVDAVAGRAPVLVDGGIREARHVIACLASGAAAVLLGRPVLWGLAVGGAKGVTHVLNRLVEDLRIAMALSGASRINELDRSLLAPG